MSKDCRYAVMLVFWGQPFWLGQREPFYTKCCKKDTLHTPTAANNENSTWKAGSKVFSLTWSMKGIPTCSPKELARPDTVFFTFKFWLVVLAAWNSGHSQSQNTCGARLSSESSIAWHKSKSIQDNRWNGGWSTHQPGGFATLATLAIWVWHGTTIRY